MVLALGLGLVGVAMPDADARDLPGTRPGGGRMPPEQGQSRSGPALQTELPWLMLAPELEASYGYSDNIFVTPDIFGLDPVEDSFYEVTPRLRALAPLTQTVGLVGDFQFDLQQFSDSDNGSAEVFDGELFIGYRPLNYRHAEIGVQGGTTRVSAFEPNDNNRIGGFLHATYGFTPRRLLFTGLDYTRRDFPKRRSPQTGSTSSSSSSTPLLLLPILGDLLGGGNGGSGETAGEERIGQIDDIVDAQAGYIQRYDQGFWRIGYEFRNLDSDIDAFDTANHSLNLAGSISWTSWLATELQYSLRLRSFDNPIATPEGPPVERDDSIQDAGLEVRLRPALFRSMPLTRHATLGLRYDFLKLGSNVESAEFERNLVSLTLSFAFDTIAAR